MNYRILTLLIAITVAGIGCDVGVPTEEEMASAEKSSAPAADPHQGSAPMPGQLNTLPPAHPPTTGDAQPPHPPITAADSSTAVAAGSIQVAEGGLTVAQIFEGREELSGKQVTLRGKVVKATPGVMGTNWYHVQDGTGGEGTNDLTITSDGQAAVGDVLLIAGTVAADKDFGMGYKYSVIVEGASLTKEGETAATD